MKIHDLNTARVRWFYWYMDTILQGGQTLSALYQIRMIVQLPLIKHPFRAIGTILMGTILANSHHLIWDTNVLLWQVSNESKRSSNSFSFASTLWILVIITHSLNSRRQNVPVCPCSHHQYPMVQWLGMSEHCYTLARLYIDDDNEPCTGNILV